MPTPEAAEADLIRHLGGLPPRETKRPQACTRCREPGHNKWSCPKRHRPNQERLGLALRAFLEGRVHEPAPNPRASEYIPLPNLVYAMILVATAGSYTLRVPIDCSPQIARRHLGYNTTTPVLRALLREAYEWSGGVMARPFPPKRAAESQVARTNDELAREIARYVLARKP